MGRACVHEVIAHYVKYRYICYPVLCNDTIIILLHVIKARCVHLIQYDLSLPVDKLYQLVEEVGSRCQHEALCTVGYGHLGDGNLHLNVVGKSHSTKLLQLIEPFVYDWTGKFNASTAEQ